VKQMMYSDLFLEDFRSPFARRRGMHAFNSQ